MPSSTALVLRNDDAGAVVRSGAAAARGSAAAASTGKEKVQNSLKHVSYWLASSQPQHAKGSDAAAADDDFFNYEKEVEALPPPLPSVRPAPHPAPH